MRLVTFVAQDLQLNAFIFNLNKRFLVLFSFVKKKFLEFMIFLPSKVI